VVTLFGTLGDDVLTGSPNDDPTHCWGMPAMTTLNGGPGDDSMAGAPATTSISSISYNDHVLEDDIVFGSDGTSTPFARRCRPTPSLATTISRTSPISALAAPMLFDNALDNLLLGNGGDDTLISTAGYDTLRGFGRHMTCLLMTVISQRLRAAIR